MAKKRKRIFRAWALLVAGLVVTLTAFGQSISSANTASQESLSIRFVHGDSAKARSPILVGVTLTNLSNEDLVFTKEIHGHQLHVDVRDTNGKSASETSLGHAWNYSTGVGIGTTQREPAPKGIPYDVGNLVFGKFKTGNSAEWQINVAKFYDMKLPGKYAIQIEMLDPQNPASRLSIKSNEIIVTVTP